MPSQSWVPSGKTYSLQGLGSNSGGVFPLNGTAQPVNIEEEGLRPTSDRQLMAEQKAQFIYVLGKMTIPLLCF